MLLKVMFTNGEVLYKDSTLIDFVNEGVCMPPSAVMNSTYESGITVVPFGNVLYIDPIGPKEE